MSFFNAAQRPMQDIGAFIKQNTSNGIKYSGVASETHRLYFPYQEVQAENGAVVRTIMAQEAKVHDIHVSPEKYESCICLKDIMRQDKNGNVLNDGTCPFCERVSDAYSIKSYREEMALEGTTLTGKELEDYKKRLSSQYAGELKVGKAKPKAYVLVAKFNTDAKGAAILGADGKPTYELKVMAMSVNRLQEFSGLFEQAQMSLAGSEVSIKYPATKDARLLVSQSSNIPCIGTMAFCAQYPGLAEKIQAEAATFDWELLENSFPEWKGMTTEAASIKCATMFNAWDKYLAEKIANPAVKYLEYSNANVVQPALAAPAPQVQTPPMPQAVPPTQMPQANQAPTMPQTPPQGNVPNNPLGSNFSMAEMNAMFGNMKL